VFKKSGGRQLVMKSAYKTVIEKILGLPAGFCQNKPSLLTAEPMGGA